MTTTTRRRTTTSQQREDRKAKAEALQATITEQVQALSDTQKWQKFLDFAASFHSYSVNNLLLILAQMPSASQVAGFRKWQQLGRQVRKGEKSIKIFGYSTKKIADANEEDGTEEKRRVYFPMLSVFDISQTDPIPGADPFSQIAPRLTGENDHGLYAATQTFLTTQGWTVEREEISEDVDGYTTTDGSKRIAINASLAPTQAAATLLHEAGHALLHATQTYTEYVERRSLKEVEAESVAYIVAGAFGLDTSTNTIGYIATWSKLNPDIIKESAASVLKAAHTLIDALTIPDPTVT